ncbi:MAG: hypothetical protein EOP18_02930 [Rhizobiaceae bacterium]|nr:MAG: hypothetical protein EOP18_02930 [Rhizobiaceae bacterium]
MKNKYIALPLIISLTTMNLMGCASGKDSASITRESDAVHKRDGEDIYRGVFFGTGKVGAELSSVWHGKTLAEYMASVDSSTLSAGEASMRRAGVPEQRVASVHELAERTASGQFQHAAEAYDFEAIILAIKSDEPGFFDSFGTELQSGDPVRVSAAFDTGLHAFQKHFLRARASGAEDAGADAGSISRLQCNTCWVDHVVAAYAYAVAAAFVVVAAAVVIPPIKDGSPSPLDQQMLIGELTSTLAAQ